MLLYLGLALLGRLLNCFIVLLGDVSCAHLSDPLASPLCQKLLANLGLLESLNRLHSKNQCEKRLHPSPQMNEPTWVFSI